MKSLSLSNLILAGNEKLLSGTVKSMPNLTKITIFLKGSAMSYEGLRDLLSGSRLGNFEMEAGTHPVDVGILIQVFKRHAVTLHTLVFGAYQVAPSDWLALGQCLLTLENVTQLRLFDGQPKQQRLHPSMDVDGMISILGQLGDQLLE